MPYVQLSGPVVQVRDEVTVRPASVHPTEFAAKK